MTVDSNQGTETTNQLVTRTAEKISEEVKNSSQKKIGKSAFQKKPKIRDFTVKVRKSP